MVLLLFCLEEGGEEQGKIEWRRFGDRISWWKWESKLEKSVLMR